MEIIMGPWFELIDPIMKIMSVYEIRCSKSNILLWEMIPSLMKF